MDNLALKHEERIRERDEEYDEHLRSMEKYARYSILPSPDLLKTHWSKAESKAESKGSDNSNTIGDFNEVFKWFEKHQAPNPGFYNFLPLSKDSGLDEDGFNRLMILAYSNAFAATRHTGNPELDELVIWYYTGHGLPTKELPYTLSMPKLSTVGFREQYNEIAKKFMPENNIVKGGELCLHHVGFCGLDGLLKPWIASVKADSQNAEGKVKKNKHLLIILDSCHSGILAEDLEKLNEKSGPWNENGCTVTVQTACGPDEVTYGGYFTPCFKFFNEDNNQGHLKRLKEEWKNMGDNEREQFKRIQLPSPKLVTTIQLTETEKTDPFFVLQIQNSKFNLFQDPGFFKFCSMQQFKVEDKLLSAERVLNRNTADKFMKSSSFKVIDYKLKKMATGPYMGTPMGLFLLEDSSTSPARLYAVCAHIHFEMNDTSKVGRINLVHHKAPPIGSILYVEDHDGKSKYKIDPTCSDARKLVKACQDFVEGKQPGRWRNVCRWDMKSGELGVIGLFKQKDERSAWMEEYLKENGYTYQDLPETTSTID